MKSPNLNKSEQINTLYDTTPYPDSVLGTVAAQDTPLLEHWINAAVAPNKSVLRADSHILIAGCGTGTEAFVIAKRFPNAKITGIDFSVKSIDLARTKLAESPFQNITFEVADLMTEAWCSQQDAFDFILCHGVADYVADPQKLLQTLATCLTPTGILYLTVNSPQHPATKIKAAYEALGKSLTTFKETTENRLLLQSMTQLMGAKAGISNLAQRSKAHLDIDIFPPIAHHFPVEKWCEQAESSGLYFCGSMDAILGLTQLSDTHLSPFYPLSKPALSLWMANLRQAAGLQLLFSPVPPPTIDFSRDNIWQWRPKLAACVGQLPPLSHPPQKVLPLTLRFQGLPDLIIYSRAYDLEVLRLCDGKTTLQEITAAIPVQGNLEHVRVCLFRAYHYGLLVPTSI